MSLPNIVSVKTALIVLALVVVGFLGWAYFNANGKNLSWCATNLNSCRIARLQALDRDYQTLNPAK